MNNQFCVGQRSVARILIALIVVVLLAGLIQPVAADSQMPSEPAPQIQAVNNSHWSTEFYPRGVNGYVSDLEIGPDGSLYIAGRFYQAGTAQVTGLARWKNNQWQAFGNFTSAYYSGPYTGLGYVNDIAISGQNIYVGGFFRYYNHYVSANNVAVWDGTRWSRLGYGIDDEVTALTLDSSGILYAGTYSGDIYSWDGTSWTLQGSADDTIEALAFDDAGTLYAAGFFTTLDGVSVNYIAMKSGGTWQPMAGGASRNDGKDPWVSDIVFWNGTLYAGGWFDAMGGIPASHLAYWQAGTWHAITGLDAGVYDLQPDGNKLWVGGTLDTISGLQTGNLAAWNGISWEVLPEQISNQSVSAIAVNGTHLFAGGNIFEAGQTGFSSIAEWTGSAWTALGEGQGAADEIQSVLLPPDQNSLYVGGRFDSIGGTPAHSIARWDGSQWHTLGDGFKRGTLVADVHALLMAGDVLYAGGYFSSSGSTPLSNIAQWNGNAWLPLGEGLASTETSGRVYALTADDAGNIYAGGYFDKSGEIIVNRVARWDGASWLPLGDGLDYTVRALAYDTTNDLLYAAGTPNGIPEPSFIGVSVWDGSSWQPLGTEPTGFVFAMKISPDGILYAGINGYELAYWTDNAWHRISEQAISSSMTDFEFDAQGGIIASAIWHSGEPNLDGAFVRWDGYRWRHLGGEVWRDRDIDCYYGEANSLEMRADGMIFLGGKFGRAGSLPSANLAGFSLGSVPTMSDFTKGLPQNTTAYFYWDAVQQSFSDADPGDWLVSLVITSLPQHGVLSMNGTPITSLPADGYDVEVDLDGYNPYLLSYTPDTDYIGSDSFTWVAGDGVFAAESSTVNLNIHSDNQMPSITDVNKGMKPTAESMNIFMTEFSPHFMDADGDELNKIKIISLPGHGTLTYHNNPVQIGDEFNPTNVYFDYDKFEGYTGEDSFLWTASDGAAYAVEPANYVITIATPIPLYLPLIQR